MKNILKLKPLIAGLGILLVSAFALNAYAASAAIESAKDTCQIGETYTGYLDIVSDETPSGDATRDMRSINQQRKAAYARIAQKNGVTVDVTAKLTAEKLMSREPAGHCIKLEDGWVTK